MNFIKHHFGDYAKEAGHLTLIEHGAYRMLIDLYCIRERPLPPDFKTICRLIRANSRHERAAVQSVLDEFFEKKEDGYHHQQCAQFILRSVSETLLGKTYSAKRWQSERQKKEVKSLNSNETADGYPIGEPNGDPNGFSMGTPMLAISHKKEERKRQKKKEDQPDPEQAQSELPEIPANAGADAPKINAFDYGVALFKQLGMSEDTARRMIGKWCRDWAPDTVHDALIAATGKADPKAYVTKYLQGKPKKSEEPAGVEFRFGQATIGGFVP